VEVEKMKLGFGEWMLIYVVLSYPLTALGIRWAIRSKLVAYGGDEDANANIAFALIASPFTLFFILMLIIVLPLFVIIVKAIPKLLRIEPNTIEPNTIEPNTDSNSKPNTSIWPHFDC
jgi:hypothetical protein